MRRSGKLALKVGAVGVAAGAVLLPVSTARAVTPPVTSPAITVTPSTGLTDGQSVTVTGTGFEASTPFVITECSALPPGASCDASGVVQGTTGADGSIPSTPFTVKEGTVGTGTCPPAAATASCYVAVTTDFAGAAPAKTGTAPITFGAAATPTVTVTPATGVKDGDTVTLSGAGFAASTGLFAVECAGSGTGPPPAQADCDLGTEATSTTDATGAFSGVKIVVHTGAVGDKTCDAGGSCDIVVTTSVTEPDSTNSGIGTFTFAAGGSTSGRAATKTQAAYSSKKQAIFGAVTSDGTGVKGLKTKLEIKKGSHWKAVDSGKTKVGGAFVFTHVTKSGTYKVKASKNAKFKGSTSHKIRV